MKTLRNAILENKMQTILSFVDNPSCIPWYYSPEKIRVSELLDVFPQAKKIIKYNISLYEKDIFTAYQQYEEFSQKVSKKTTNDFSLWFWLEVGKTFILGEAISLEWRVKQLKRILLAKEIRREFISSKGVTDRDIEDAKMVRIETILTVNGAGFALCPFHKEKTPSFKVFKENRWYCFGACQRHGDVIDIVKKLHSFSFIESVKFLLRYG